MRIVADFGRLLVLILFLPLFVILVGPLLILAVLRGRQPVGPIILDTSRRGPAGKVGAFVLGLLIWILIWGGLAWLGLRALSPFSPTIAGLPLGFAATATLESPVTPSLSLPTVAVATSTFTPPPPVPDTPGATFTPQLTPLETATATPTPLIVSAPTPTPLRTATTLAAGGSSNTDATPASLAGDSDVATNTPTVTLTPPQPTNTVPAADDAATATPGRATTLTLQDQQAAIAAVEEGNVLLREAIVLANAENLQNLTVIWQDRALTTAQTFASEVYERYAKPLKVTFDYLDPPVFGDRASTGDVEVISREVWRYRSPSDTEDEAFEFTYTLNQEGGRWVITRYTYRNLPLPTATASSTPGGTPETLTPTPPSGTPENQAEAGP